MHRFYTRVIIVTIILGGLCVPVAPAATFYVDPATGSAAGDGSAANPWRTLEEVFDAGLVESRNYAGSVTNAGAPVTGGDTILLRSGLHGDIDLFQYFNDVALTVAAEDGHTPILKRWSVTGGTNWVIRGLTINPETYGALTGHTLIVFVNHNFHGPVNDITVEDCIATTAADSSAWTAQNWEDFTGAGISVGGPRSIIRGNTVKNVDFGISVGGSDHLIEGNTIENYAGDGVRCGGDRISIIGNTIMNSYNVNGNHDDAIQFFSGYGVGASDVTIRGNTIIGFPDPAYPLRHGPQGVGCFDGPYTNWVVENNVVMVDHWHGITMYRSSGCRIVNNTVFSPMYHDGQSGMHPWIDLTPNAGGAVNNIRNNVASVYEFATGMTVVADHNLVVPRAADASTWFADYANFDMRLVAGSPAIDAGVSALAPTVDIDGFLRPAGTAVDAGAHEFGSGPDAAVVADAGPDLTVYDTDGDGMAAIPFDGSASYANYGAIASYQWLFGLSPLVSGETASLTFGLGTFTFTLKVTDEFGSVATDDVVVTITDAPPAIPGDADSDGDVDLDDFVILKSNFGTPSGAAWGDGDFDGDGDVDLDDFVLLKGNFGQ